MSPTAVPVHELFVSYSRTDESKVRDLVKLLRSTGSTVFQDVDSIPPGKPWAWVLSTSIEACRLMYVFWCHHAAGSDEVRKEYEQAIALQKDVVPVLLDDTVLPGPLKTYQWLDLRDLLGPHSRLRRLAISRAEGMERQRLSNIEHRVPRDADAFTGGDFAREGWQLQGDEFVREVIVEDVEPSTAGMEAAAARLGAMLASRALVG
jgi:TIR domain